MATVCYNDLNLVLNCDREIYKIFFWSRQQILQNKTSWPFFCDKVVLNQTYRHIQALKKELKWDPFLGLFGFLWGLFFTWWAQKNSLEPRKGWGAVGSKSLDFTDLVNIVSKQIQLVFQSQIGRKNKHEREKCDER